MKKYFNFFIVFVAFLSYSFAYAVPALIPYPNSVKYGTGNFKLNKNTTFLYSGNSIKSDVSLFADYVKALSGIKLNTKSKKSANCIKIEIDKNSKPEAYTLSIKEKSILIKGGNDGVFYGLQTLCQLVDSTTKAEVAFPVMEISDSPRFAWRGMHLDVSRHFFGKEFIKKYIDYLAAYKFNVFHWHLTDDQGWRIEIKKYPELTKVGAYRDGTLIGAYSAYPHRFDEIRYGGFYTQNDIKEIVKYAQSKHVAIVPEIEMPGHALAALASYPDLSCTGVDHKVSQLWGVFDDVFCAKDETFKFLEDVLSEVVELFPGEYIHVGGDECPKVRWRKCSKCQETMRINNLKNENELQSYFISRIEKFLNLKGKKVIGWDEILEGGLAPNAAVMSWRGTEGGIAAAKQKHNVVMTPGSHCYFDHYQGNPKNEPLAIGGYTTVEKVYSFEPIPSELNKEEAEYVIGAQANIWTEYIPSEKQVEYMLFPRMCALSEVLWDNNKPGWEDFKNRLMSQLPVLEKRKINYSNAIFEIEATIQPNDAKKGVLVSFNDPRAKGIKYTLDESAPDNSAPNYTTPLNINKECILKASYFENGVKKRELLDQKFFISKTTGKNVTLTTQPDERYNAGGAFTLVDGIYGRTPWYGKEWLGFSGKDFEAIVDLGATETLRRVSVGFLSEVSSWIHFPKSVELFYSDDGINFKSVIKFPNDEFPQIKRMMHFQYRLKARYIKIKAENIGKIPNGLPGEGYDAWLFVDEISAE